MICNCGNDTFLYDEDLDIKTIGRIKINDSKDDEMITLYCLKCNKKHVINKNYFVDKNYINIGG